MTSVLILQVYYELIGAFLLFLFWLQCFHADDACTASTSQVFVIIKHHSLYFHPPTPLGCLLPVRGTDMERLHTGPILYFLPGNGFVCGSNGDEHPGRAQPAAVIICCGWRCDIHSQRYTGQMPCSLDSRCLEILDVAQ